MRYFVIFLILAGFTGIAFAEEWYPGIGLEKGDFFAYDACAMWDNTICYPFEMTLLITDQTDDDWNVQMIINEDDGKTFEGHMMISKNNAYVTAYDNQWSTRHYVNFYRETISHLGVYSSAEKPSRLDQSPFGGKVWIGVTPAITKPTEEITLSFATIKTTPISWYHQEISSTIWVSEDISFPVRGEIKVNPRNETNARYKFELKEYGTGSSLIEKPQRMNGGRISPDDTIYPVPWETRSPLKQFESGIPASEIQCKEELELILKSSDGSPACVKPETKQKLIERGWVKDYSRAQDGLVNHRDLHLIERYKDLPEVQAFYAKYADADVSVREDHMSYFAGNEDDFRVRMDLYFDENYDLEYIDFHCYVERQHKTEVAQEDILSYLENYDCEE